MNFPLAWNSNQNVKSTTNHERHSNRGFQKMPDPDFSPRWPGHHKLDVVVFVPVAFNQFLTRPLFCVGKTFFSFFTFIEEFDFFGFVVTDQSSLIRVLETRWLPCHANAAARGQLRKIHRDALNQHSKVCTHNQNYLSKLCVLLLRRHKITWTWRNISMLVECS